MKIEKVNDNQIRFTLDKVDLVEREIKISELAYGSEKAQSLFKDMMTEAFDKYGFEASNIPLMIEAVPLSTESIMIIVTKVSDKEELEEKLIDLSSNKQHEISESTDEDIDKLDTPNIDSEKSKISKSLKIYSFNNLDLLCDAAERIPEKINLKNTLYKDPDKNIFYLLLSYNKPTQKIVYVNNLLSEYSAVLKHSHLFESYLKEHGEIVIKSRALQKMKAL